MAEKDYVLAFSVCGAIGPKRFISLINLFGSAQKAWVGSKNEYESLGIKLKTYNSFDEFRKALDIENYLLKLKKASVEFIPQKDKRYPKKLLELESPPIGLFVKGNTKLLRGQFCLGVVGTRKVTSYGREVTDFLVSELVKNGIVIISGLALGIDGIAHRRAVDNRGATIAVLACGVDCCLPSENYSLYSSILENNGLIISEYPLAQFPNKGTFLARNRIIAALSDGVLVTEAAKGSGSLVTAEYGLQLGRKVFAVPGPITSRMSDGTSELLKNGAKFVSNIDDILEDLSVPISQRKTFKNLNLNDNEKKIIALLENEGLTIDEIAIKTKLPVHILMTLVSGLELRGVLKNNSGEIRLL